MVGAVIVTHGSFGRELLRAAEGIAGSQEEFAVISNEDLSIDKLERKLAEVLREGNFKDGVILFTDLFGGSCWKACMKIASDIGWESFGGMTVLSGINLCMFLSFLYKKSRLEYPELVKTLEIDGKRGVILNGKD